MPSPVAGLPAADPTRSDPAIGASPGFAWPRPLLDRLDTESAFDLEE
jgi:hypothetical protein